MGEPATSNGPGREPSQSALSAIAQGAQRAGGAGGAGAKGATGTSGAGAFMGIRDNDLGSLLRPSRRQLR